MNKRKKRRKIHHHSSKHKFFLLVSGSSQGQDNGISYLQHGLEDGSNNNEEDDGEEEGSVDDLKLDEASLDSQDQQGDSFCHPPTEHKQAGGLKPRRHVDKMASTNPDGPTCAWCCHS